MDSEGRIKVVGFMTAPRYESTFARGCIERAFKGAGIPLVVSQGVFYGQCMQRMLEKAIIDNVDIAITVDFDSIFTTDDLLHLVAVMARGEFDSVAALQSRRSSDQPLFMMEESSTVEFSGEPVEVKMAHFGLTGIDLSKLKDVPKPWFNSKPREDGTWGPGKTDDDVSFWRQWEKAGNKVYVDARLRIGHLEEVISGYDEQLKHRFTYPNDWFEKEVVQKMLKDGLQE